MKIEFDLPEEQLAKIRALLISNMNLANGDSLNEKLNDLAKSAFLEYVNMITDSGMPTKVTDILQTRIIFLIDNYFKRFPNEDELARMFNIPLSRSRSILNNLKSTHRNKLEEKLKAEITKFLSTNKKLDDTRWEFEVKSRPIIQELNEFIALRNPGLEKFKQKTDCAGKVTLHVDSYDFLKTKY